MRCSAITDCGHGPTEIDKFPSSGGLPNNRLSELKQPIATQLLESGYFELEASVQACFTLTCDLQGSLGCESLEAKAGFHPPLKRISPGLRDVGQRVWYIVERIFLRQFF